MIKNYSVKNFRGIVDSFNVSFEAEAKRKSEGSQVVKVGKHNILLASAVMGVNGSGKSTLLDSLYFYNVVQEGFISKFISRRVEEQKLTPQQAWEEYADGLFGNEKNPIEFSIEFIDDANIVNHSISVLRKGIISEKILFNGELTESKSSVFDFKSKIDEFSFKKIDLIDWDAMDDAKSVDQVIKINKKHPFRNKKLLVHWLRIADKKLVDITFGEETIKTATFEFRNKKSEIPFNEASSGTIKWLNIGVKLFEALLIRQSLFSADEIEKSLHISLVDFIIRIFSNNKINKMRSQLFFTTHSPAIIGDYFRKDAINYIDDFRIFNLGKDLKIRKDVVFSKNYIEQNLGSHPDASTKYDFLTMLEELENGKN